VVDFLLGGGGGDDKTPYKIYVGFRSLPSSIVREFIITVITVASGVLVFVVGCGRGAIWLGCRCHPLASAICVEVPLEIMMYGAYRDPEACGLECGTGGEAA
jgi:hypothetical protein